MKGGTAALKLPEETISKMVAEFARRRDYLVGRLRKMPGVTCLEPKGAFYVFPTFSSYYGRKWDDKPIRDSIDMAAFLLDRAKVAGIPGAAFHADGHQRFSFATSLEELEKAADRIEEALTTLA
jgi:aspartate aminotransferase